MSDVVIVALITGGVTLLGSILTFITTNKQMQAQQKKAYEEQLSKFKSEITDKLEEHRTEYLKGISEVQDSITDMRSAYQQTVAIVELKIDSLEKKQDKHNNLIERTFKLETDVEVLKNRESVTEHRLQDLERDEKK